MKAFYFANLSYEQVVVKYKDTVGKICLLRLNNPLDAEDCFQNVFTKLLLSRKDFENEEHLKAWLIKVAINECKNHIRDNKPLLPLKDCEKTAVYFEQDSCDISWAMMKLGDKYRNVLYLHYIERYKIDEIAKILGKSRNTVKTLLKRGREQLKKIYGGDDV